MRSWKLSVYAVTLILAVLSCKKTDQPVTPTPDIPDVKGATVKGAVRCQGKGVSSVVVSDGYEVVQTDENGYFWLKSAKKKGYVFISIPSGYMPEGDAALPAFWQTVSSSKGTETLYFNLVEEKNESFDLVVSTDFHLADRYSSSDITSFKEVYVPALKEYAGKSKPAYNIVLGDMTWDIYWDNYSLTNYKAMANQFPIKTFHVIGNHDYDMEYQNDAKAEQQYISKLGPVWYSFNLGNNHIVVLDDVVYKNTSGDRSHDTYVSDEQIEWLKKDLSYVPSGKRIFVAMHCTAFKIKSITSDGKLDVGLNFDPAGKEQALLDCFKGREVHFITGDTHINQSIPPESGCCSNESFYEHNVAAVCSSWWWTWYLSKNHICKDGSEGGFLVFSANGKDLSWRYRSFEYGFERQFRAYDMNEVKSRIKTDPMYAVFYNVYGSREKYTSIPENAVLVNVWNWDPRWTVKVTENGSTLPVVWKSIEDPLHTLSYDAPRTYDNGEITSSFRTIPTQHIFMVKASSATSTLEIEVKDQFGNVSRETMERPRKFTTEK